MNQTPAPTRLLIVEDERIVAFDLKQKLEGLGYAVVGTVANGLDAVRDAENLRPDLVLMDIHLEGDIDGIEAARGIAESFGIPVIFLTAYATDDVLQRIQDGIAEGFVVKPFDIRMLHASIQTALARHRVTRSRDSTTARMRAAMQAVEMGTFEWDGTTDTVLVRGGPAEALGQAWRHGGEPFEAFVGRIHWNDREPFRAWFRQEHPAGTRVSREFHYLRSDGTTTLVRIIGQFERATDDAASRFMGIVREVVAEVA